MRFYFILCWLVAVSWSAFPNSPAASLSIPTDQNALGSTPSGFQEGLLPNSGTITRDGHLAFRKVSIEQGLSQSSVQTILQDDIGYMWFGTEDGLNRFDGYDFRVFKHDPENPDSLSSNNILALFQDHAGSIWIGTSGGGLDRYDQPDGRFIHYRADDENPNSLSSNFILNINEDRFGNLWVGTSRGGLNRFDRQNGVFTTYQHVDQGPASLSGNSVLGLYVDPEDILWVATEGGLDQYDYQSDSFLHLEQIDSLPMKIRFNELIPMLRDSAGMLWVGTSQGAIRLDPGSENSTIFQHDPEDQNSLSDNEVRSIHLDESGMLWIGTYGGGLNLFNAQRGTFTSYQYDKLNPDSLGSNFIYKIYEDRGGLLWIGTFGGGVYIFDRKLERFAHYYSDPNDPNSLSENSIFDMDEDRQGFIWLASYGGGLNRFDPETGLFTHYKHNADDPGSLADNEVWSVYEDQNGDIWVGTNSGLDRLDPTSQQFIHYRHEPNDPGSLSHNIVLAMVEDQDQHLWVGTEHGLNLYDREQDRFVRYVHDPDDPNSLSGNSVWCLLVDSQGTLWIGTNGGGLNRFDPQAGRFSSFQNDPEDPNSLSHNTVLAMYEDHLGTLWIGTWGGGLNRLEVASGTISHYTEKNGLPNDVVYGILEDQEGHLWLSTNNGISCFDPEQETFRNFTAVDGLQSNEFNLNSHLKNRDGEFYFGGINGLTGFYPDQITFSTQLPPMAISTIRINNQVYREDVTDEDDVRLGYQNNFLSFDFVLLDYRAPQHNLYAYKMEGIDQDWVYAETRRHADYPNLPPGSYTFQVKGATSEGVWNEQGAAIAITIAPPIWGTWWFRGGLILLLAAGAFSAYRLRVQGIEAKRRDLEQQVEERTQALEALNEIAATVSESLDPDETLKSALDKILQLIKIDAAGIYLLDENSQLLNLAAQRGLNLELVNNIDHLKVGEGFSGQVIQTGKPLVVEDISTDPRLTRTQVLASGFHSIAVVPLITKGKVLGTLFVISRTPQVYGEKALSLLASIGNHLGIAVENARLYEDTNRRLAQLAALQETNQALVSTLKLNDLLNLIIEQATTLLQAEGGILNLVDWELMEDEVVACVGTITGLLGLRTSLHNSLSGWVTIHNQPEISNQLREDRRADRRGLTEDMGARLQNAALAPLTIKEQVIGTLVVIDKLGGAGDFDQSDLHLLTAFANQAATAIENARLYTAEHRRAEQFRVIAEVGRQFAFVPDMEAVLNQVAQVIQKAFGYYHVGIGLVEDNRINYRVGAGQLWENPDFEFRPNPLEIGLEGITGWVASTGKPLLVPDVGKEPRYVSMQGSETRSELIVPIIVKGRVIGVLDAQSDKLNAFDQSDLAVLEALAHQAGTAIENARLYEQSQRLAVLEERSRLARELHDAVTQTLFSASLMAEALPSVWEKDITEGHYLLQELRGLSRGALAEMRTLLLELRPAALVETRLEDLLRQLVEAASGREGIPVNLIMEGKGELPQDVHIALYRIAQEAMNNIVKHARARRASVRLCFTCADQEEAVQAPVLSVLLSIKDDGRGFNLQNIPQDRLGLGIMNERAQAIKASLTIDSNPGEGTQISVLWEQRGQEVS